MKKPAIALVLFTVLVPTFADAGTYSFVSMVGSASTPTTSGWYIDGASGSFVGKTAYMSLSGHIKVEYENGYHSLYAEHLGAATWKVKWTPSYSGEPAPLEVTAKFHYKRYRYGWVGLIDGLSNPGYFNAYLATSGFVDPGLAEISETKHFSNPSPGSWNPGTGIYGSTTAQEHDVTSQKFHFSMQNGEWIGTTTIDIGQQVSGSLDVEANVDGQLSVELGFQIYDQLELLEVDGHAV